MIAPTNSRVGKRIGRKACDICRERKVQCLFEEGHERCNRCRKAEIECKFERLRKPRGPVSKIIEKARQENVPTTVPSSSLHSASGEAIQVSLEQFCSIDTFHIIFADYVSLVYPLLPIIHLPSFQARLAEHEYLTSPAFLRQCIAIAAVTATSLQRLFTTYWKDSQYDTVTAMLAQAVRLISLSRIISDPSFASSPNLEHITTSLLIGYSAAYTGDHGLAWMWLAEGTLFTRMMNLGSKRSYEGLGPVETELRKRAFWQSFIVQVHDRISHTAPHTGLSYQPRLVDWDFTMPMSVHDDELEDMELGDDTPPSIAERGIPRIAGYVALLQVFRCFAELVSMGIPGSVEQSYSIISSPPETQIFASSPGSSVSSPPAAGTNKSISAITNAFQRLGAVIQGLPEELKLPDVPFPDDPPPEVGTPEAQFAIMRANIYITALYLQSNIVDTYANTSRSVAALTARDPSDDAVRIRSQIWSFRQAIARDLVHVLDICRPWTLEANGASWIVKVREIGAALLDDEDLQIVEEDSKQTAHGYVQKFVDILSKLDWAAKMGKPVVTTFM